MTVSPNYPSKRDTRYGELMTKSKVDTIHRWRAAHPHVKAVTSARAERTDLSELYEPKTARKTYRVKEVSKSGEVVYHTTKNKKRAEKLSDATGWDMDSFERRQKTNRIKKRKKVVGGA